MKTTNIMNPLAKKVEAINLTKGSSETTHSWRASSPNFEELLFL